MKVDRSLYEEKMRRLKKKAIFSYVTRNAFSFRYSVR